MARVSVIRSDRHLLVGFKTIEANVKMGFGLGRKVPTEETNGRNLDSNNVGICRG